jgi:ElaB/YqjD/DUF883 family membrane-anchored ribosome-binding protein
MADVRKSTHKSVDKLFDKAERIGESGKETIARVKEKASEIKEGVDDFISDNPEKSVMIALGVGIIAGGLLAALLMKKKKK